MFRFRIDRDVEQSHGCSLQIGRAIGISFSIQWRGWQPQYTDEFEERLKSDPYSRPEDGDVYDPFMLRFNIFVWDTFLGRHPQTDPRCCSNGTTLLNWTVIKPNKDD